MRSSMKNVVDFIDDHVTSDRVIILGQCPSSKTKASANGTFARLKKWCDAVDLHEWDFHNVIHDKINSYDPADVDVATLIKKTKGKQVVIALGGFVERICKKYAISCYKVDHPSPRNRNLNDPDYELRMLKSLKRFLDEHRNNGLL